VLERTRLYQQQRLMERLSAIPLHFGEPEGCSVSDPNRARSAENTVVVGSLEKRSELRELLEYLQIPEERACLRKKFIYQQKSNSKARRSCEEEQINVQSATKSLVRRLAPTPTHNEDNKGKVDLKKKGC